MIVFSDSTIVFSLSFKNLTNLSENCFIALSASSATSPKKPAAPVTIPSKVSPIISARFEKELRLIMPFSVSSIVVLNEPNAFCIIFLMLFLLANILSIASATPVDICFAKSPHLIPLTAISTATTRSTTTCPTLAMVFFNAPLFIALFTRSLTLFARALRSMSNIGSRNLITTLIALFKVTLVLFQNLSLLRKPFIVLTAFLEKSLTFRSIAFQSMCSMVMLKCSANHFPRLKSAGSELKIPLNALDTLLTTSAGNLKTSSQLIAFKPFWIAPCIALPMS